MEQLKGLRLKFSAEKEPTSYELNPSEPVFTSRYLGKAWVIELFNPANGYDLSCKYTEQLLKETKNGHKASKVELEISTNVSRGVLLTDPNGNLPEQHFQLQNIAFCTTIKKHPKVFAFIAEQGGKLECNAFLCSKKEKSRALCLAVTKAFTVAHSEWSKKRARVISKKERNAVIADIMVNKQEEDEKEHQRRHFHNDEDELPTDDDLDEYKNNLDVMNYVRGDRSASEATDCSFD